MIVSGEERLVKPDPAIFRILVDRHGLDPATTVFVDDLARNVEAAAALGFRTIRFTTPEALRVDLAAQGLPVSAGSPPAAL